MIYDFHRSGYKNWLIVEEKFVSDHVGKTESIFCLGNGYLGLRSSNEEKNIKKIKNMFLNGVFNKAQKDEVSELANIPDILEFDILIDGSSVPFNEQTITSYSKELNMKDGILSRIVEVKTDEYTANFTFERFVSLDNKHIIGQNIKITINKDCQVEIYSGIDGQVSNSGCQHFDEGNKRLYGNIMQQIVTTNQSEIKVSVNTAVKTSGESDELIQMDRRKIFKRIKINNQKNEEIEFEKISYICSTIDKEYENDEEIGEKSKLDFQKILEDGYQKLKTNSINKWNEYWVDKDIEIKGFDYGETAMRFAQFHLRAHTNVLDQRMNIGAKGLSGEGYKGHAFWDTELFMLPYFIYTQPEAAKNLIKYRYLGLEGAHKKAQNMGYEGAMYPWESAWPSDGEVTPVWGAADIKTGLATKIESGFIQLHITADVIYGLWLYYKVTDDVEFLKEFGFEMILDTAKFWLSRVEKTERGYELKQIMGPNEYKEHIDNDAFTNHMMKWNVDLAIKYIEKYDLFNELKKFNFTIEQLKDLSENIYLQKINKELILPENDTFLNLKQIDLTKYKNQKNVGLMFEDYNLEEVQKIQVCKQADVLVLFLLLEDEFSKEEKIANFEFYEKRTLHDSSLSLSTHSVLASDLNQKEMAYDLYKKSLDIDLGQNMKTSDHGIHMASYGGMWQSVVYGFGGVRFTDESLRIDPNLPKSWNELKFNIKYKNQKLEIKIDQNNLFVKNQGNKTITFTNKGVIHIVDPKLEIKI